LPEKGHHFVFPETFLCFRVRLGLRLEVGLGLGLGLGLSLELRLGLRSGLEVDTQKKTNKSIFDKSPKSKEKVDFDNTLKT